MKLLTKVILSIVCMGLVAFIGIKFNETPSYEYVKIESQKPSISIPVVENSDPKPVEFSLTINPILE